ncbi:hypothetical protein ACFFX0_03725 [Citricoccus parietis]|uniref:Integrase SAM-like N-terminal domain-containing protein n=1 Tax=Citricoccus parietis TaxID=592307 RepID=A0ABV5FUI1_9MICC
MDGRAKAHVDDSTIGDYESINRNWIVPVLGHYRLDKLTAEHIELLHAEIREAGRAPSMGLKAHRVLSLVLKDAVQHGLLGINPCSGVDAPRTSSARRATRGRRGRQDPPGGRRDTEQGTLGPRPRPPPERGPRPVLG